MAKQIMKNFKLLLLTLSFCSLFFLLSCGGDSETSTDPLSYELSISSSTNEVTEGGSALNLTVSLDKDNADGADVTVGYTVEGVATEGDDFESLSGSVTIANGDRTAQIAITTVDDIQYEGNEWLLVTLVEGTNQTLAESSSVAVLIVENDEGLVCDYTVYTDRDPCDTNAETSNYNESISSDTRTVSGAGLPNHDYGNQFDELMGQDVDVTAQNYSFTFTSSPTVASQTTGILNDQNRPSIEFGIALNAIPIDPAPAEPFIFENPNTGEFNWDWVFEPNNNKEQVGLDCAVAHVQPDGAYHYHGDMAPLADLMYEGISCGTVPGYPVQIGWAADGFPIIYKYGPNSSGTQMTELTSSYQLKTGMRPGNDITEPSGMYDGTYTNDYEYSAGSGDLDECNGISRSITLYTQAGRVETFEYFYVITDEFPIIGRCLSGDPDDDFSK